ncbi:hypothetical protein [Rhizobium laguerreae]|uniref:Transmembrane protein n=1 Tax=Rhizobium laguerreae TaxID=1076926 RepID=A0AAX2QLM3_9HYPH|nr:hypothetical protein [Rhizobium laguerreae]TCU25276.1 hypothetical protein EV131_105390 [Rhizobium laguerreae]
MTKVELQDDFSQVGRVILGTILFVVAIMGAMAFMGFGGVGYVVYQHYSDTGCPGPESCSDLRWIMRFAALMSTIGLVALVSAIYVCYRDIMRRG